MFSFVGEDFNFEFIFVQLVFVIPFLSIISRLIFTFPIMPLVLIPLTNQLFFSIFIEHVTRTAAVFEFSAVIWFILFDLFCEFHVFAPRTTKIVLAPATVNILCWIQLLVLVAGIMRMHSWDWGRTMTFLFLDRTSYFFEGSNKL